VFPHASVYVQVLVIVSGHVNPSDTSAPVTVPGASQLSVYPKSIIAGTSPIHCTATAAGVPAITGTCVS